MEGCCNLSYRLNFSVNKFSANSTFCTIWSRLSVEKAPILVLADRRFWPILSYQTVFLGVTVGSDDELALDLWHTFLCKTLKV